MNWNLIGASAGADIRAACASAWAGWSTENRAECEALGADTARSIFALAALQTLAPDLAGTPVGPTQIAAQGQLLAIRSRLEAMWSEAALEAEERARTLWSRALLVVEQLVRQIGAIGLRALVLVLAG